MKRTEIVSIVSALTLLTLVSGCAPAAPPPTPTRVCMPPKISGVNVNLIPQQRDCWCWAACTEMISEYYGHRIDQCESANYVHGTPPDCCTGCTGDCPGWGWDWGASIGAIQDNWTHWAFDYTYTASSLSWGEVKNTVSTSEGCLKSPIYVVWWWTGGGGHVITAYGYAEAGGEEYVAYRNPWPPDCEEPATPQDQCTPVSGGEEVVSTYDAFVDDGVHEWGDSFYGFKYTGD